MLIGAQLSDQDDRDWLYTDGKLAGARPILGPDEPVDFRPFWTQRTQCANDCVAFTTATLIEICSKIHDPTPIPFSSPLFLYQRAVRDQRRGSFVDDGSQFRFVLKAARESLVAESDWPEDPKNVFLVPPADLYSLAGIEAFYRIPDLSECERRGLPAPSQQVGDVMRRGFPVGCVMKVDRSFARMGAHLWTGPLGRDGTETAADPYWEGYHAQAVIVSGGGKKGLGSSWGAGTGDDGIYWLTDEAFDNYCAEFWVAQAAPLDL